MWQLITALDWVQIIACWLAAPQQQKQRDQGPTSETKTRLDVNNPSTVHKGSRNRNVFKCARMTRGLNCGPFLPGLIGILVWNSPYSQSGTSKLENPTCIVFFCEIANIIIFIGYTQICEKLLKGDSSCCSLLNINYDTHEIQHTSFGTMLTDTETNCVEVRFLIFWLLLKWLITKR